MKNKKFTVKELSIQVLLFERRTGSCKK